jgi:hypothetical protein
MSYSFGSEQSFYENRYEHCKNVLEKTIDDLEEAKIDWLDKVKKTVLQNMINAADAIIDNRTMIRICKNRLSNYDSDVDIGSLVNLPFDLRKNINRMIFQ